MDKTITNTLLTNTLLSNIINLENSITEKDCTIINLRKEISNLKARVESLLEQNKSLEQERFNLSVHMDKLNASTVAAAKDENADMLDKYNTLVEKVSNLKVRVKCLLSQNRNLEQDWFNLSTYVEKLNVTEVVTKKDANEEEKNKSYFLPGGISFDVTNEAQLAIFNACKKLCVRLIEKNKVGEKSTITSLQLLQAFIHIIR